MNINLSDVPTEGRMYLGIEPASVLDLDSVDGFKQAGDIKFCLKAIHIPEILYIFGELKAEVQFWCGRCRESFSLEIRDPEFSSSWKLSEDSLVAPTHMEDVSQKNERTPRHIGVEGGQNKAHFIESVDLTPDIREAIILAFPRYPVCSKECEGLCACCGTNLKHKICECAPPIDDRWEELDMIKVREDPDGRT